jgi:hypothetical protein
MRTLDDLADYIRARRAAYDRGFEAELAKLRVTYGNRDVEEALQIAREEEAQDKLRDRLSISAGRKRQHREKIAERRAAVAFRAMKAQ